MCEEYMRRRCMFCVYLPQWQIAWFRESSMSSHSASVLCQRSFDDSHRNRTNNQRERWIKFQFFSVDAPRKTKQNIIVSFVWPFVDVNMTILVIFDSPRLVNASFVVSMETLFKWTLYTIDEHWKKRLRINSWKSSTNNRKMFILHCCSPVSEKESPFNSQTLWIYNADHVSHQYTKAARVSLLDRQFKCLEWQWPSAIHNHNAVARIAYKTNQNVNRFPTIK